MQTSSSEKEKNNDDEKEAQPTKKDKKKEEEKEKETDRFDGLRVLSLRWCALQSRGAKLLCDGLHRACFEGLERLDLMGNEIGVSGHRAVAQLLTPGVDLDDFAVHSFAAVLEAMESGPRGGSRWPRLSTLVLSYNASGDAGVGYVGKALCLNRKLKHLELEGCGLGDNGLKYLRRGLERNRSLRSLNIAANCFGPTGMTELQQCLVRNAHLEELDLSRNRIGPSAAKAIAEGMIMNRSLRKLRLNVNRTGSRGAQFLAKMLVDNHALEHLELSYNELFDEGAQLIAKGLIQNRGLRRLVLWHNGLEDSAARQLARCLATRAKQPCFRDAMLAAFAEARPQLFLIIEPQTQTGDDGAQESKHQKKTQSKQKRIANPETITVCECIVDFLPTHMLFEVDITHNRKVSRNGVEALLKVCDAELLCTDRRERNRRAQLKHSLY